MENKGTRLEGTITKVIYYNDSNGYTVLNLSTEDDDSVIVVGELGILKEGENLILEGTYSNHSRFGMQFRAVYCQRKLPTELENIERYLASGIVANLGEATAKKIVEAFGVETFKIIENEPHRLAEITGISKAFATKIGDEFKRLFKLRELMEYLSKFGLQPAVAMKAFNIIEEITVETVKNNPYILCKEGIDVEFSSVEVIAIAENIDINCFARAAACFNSVLNADSMNGNTCMIMEDFYKECFSMLHITKEILKKNIEEAIDNDYLSIYVSDSSTKYIYLSAYYKAERYIARKVAIMSTLKPDMEKDFSKDIDYVEKSTGMQYGKLQRMAINKALNSNFMILTGNPGTGKTTTLNAIITMFKNRGLKVKITAPTGRASKRIFEVTGYEATTIHRLLEVDFDNPRKASFVHNEENPISCNVLIVDETSMVDTLLFESLLRAISVTCQVVLVGDGNQLPSVGAGNVLRDLIECNLLNVVTLTEIFRQAQESDIIMNAHRIIKGEYPDIKTKKDGDFFFLQRLKVNKAVSTIVELWKTRLPKAYGYDPIDSIQVLTPSRKGVLGTVNLNKVMQDAVNPKVADSIEFKNECYTFRLGDKVMQIKNNYDIIWKKGKTVGKGIYNGDIGIIKHMSKEKMEIDFDGRIVEYNKEILEQLELAYAITIHKSQGSEFDAVIMPMIQNFKKLSYRNLLYTGVTRAKKLLVMVGSVRELEHMVDNNKKILRNTCLRDMLENEFN